MVVAPSAVYIRRVRNICTMNLQVHREFTKEEQKPWVRSWEGAPKWRWINREKGTWRWIDQEDQEADENEVSNEPGTSSSSSSALI